MTIRLERNDERGRDGEAGFDLQTLLHPAGAFAHPRDVVADRDMTIDEKRAILASWASDACAVESAPELRIAPSGKLVTFDEVMEALRALDQQAVAYGKPQPHYRRVLADRIPGVFRRKSRQAHGTGAPQA